MVQTTPSGKIRSLMKWVGWVLLFQLILINISASLHAWKFTHFYRDPALRVVHPSSRNPLVRTWKLFSGIRFPRQLVTDVPQFPVDTVLLRTRNHLNIKAWFGRTDSLHRGTVILFHGLNMNKGMLLPVASEFRYLGYDVLLVDLRGHGDSGGDQTSLGYRESEEVRLAYQYVQARGEQHIFLWGMSLGSVIIIKALHDYGLQPEGILLESPFASLQYHLMARSRALGFPEQPFGFLVTLWTGIEQGYNGFRYRPAEYARDVHCPVLLQWGDADRYVLREETESIFSHLATTRKRLVVYPGVDHELLALRHPAVWRSEVERFLRDPGATAP